MTIQARRFRLRLVLAIGSAITVALVVVLLVIDPDRQASPDDTVPNAPAGTTTNPRANPRTPAVPPDTALPTAAPDGVVWSLVGQAAVPTSADGGPQRLSGCAASGFAHTPVGALIAAAQISTRSGYYAGRSCWEPTITGQFVPSAEQEMLLSAL